MAFQRPFLISLKRQDSNLRWGFGIKGGRDYGEPLTIHTVGEESLAEKFGLREGDEVIQVGRVNVQDLTLGQVHELLARCGNKIEMFVVREDLLSPRKGKEPPVVRTVVHNPYNSPLSLYSTENIAETLAKQTEVLTEGHVSTEEDEGPESLSFKQKSAVFQLLEEQAKQESSSPTRTAVSSVQVKKPKSAPPPPPKPKPPSNEQIFNGYDSSSHHQVYQDQQKSTSRVEYQTTQKVVNQYQYQQEQPSQYQQQSTVYQTYQKSPGYQSPLRENVQAPQYSSSVNSYQQYQGHQSPTPTYQQPNYQQSSHQQSNYQQPSYQQPSYQQPSHQKPSYQQSNSNYQQEYQTSVNISQQSGHQSPVAYQPLNQINYQQGNQQGRSQGHQSQTHQQTSYQQPKAQKSPTAVSKAEFKVAPAPPPRVASTKQQDNMTAVYKQQYEQHLQKQYEQQQQQLLLNAEEDATKPRAHIIDEDIFEHNCTSGTPITYKAPPAAPPKPHWPPPPPQQERFRSPHQLDSPPNGMLKNVGSVWPPKRSTAVELPRTGFNPAAVREQGGSGRRCVWPPPSDENRSGRNTPQSPMTGRRIQWNPSPSPPTTRRSTYSSPARRKDIQWPPPAPMANGNGPYDNGPRPSPRLSRKAQFDDYIHEHASVNVPQTYRPPPGTQHIEFR